MIDIKFSTKDDLSITLVGHAGYDAWGKDIVCAGVSTLFFTLMRKADMDSQKGLLFYDANVGNKNEIRIYNIRGYYRKEAEAYFDAIIKGLDMMAMEYPKYISMKRVD